MQDKEREELQEISFEEASEVVGGNPDSFHQLGIEIAILLGWQKRP